MINIQNLNAAINRAMNALRSKPVKSNPDARAALRLALGCLNEARLLLNQGDARAAYWTASSAQEFVSMARRDLASAQ
jgi:hypothetical protein